MKKNKRYKKLLKWVSDNQMLSDVSWTGTPPPRFPWDSRDDGRRLIIGRYPMVDFLQECGVLEEMFGNVAFRSLNPFALSSYSGHTDDRLHAEELVELSNVILDLRESDLVTGSGNEWQNDPYRYKGNLSLDWTDKIQACQAYHHVESVLAKLAVATDLPLRCGTLDTFQLRAFLGALSCHAEDVRFPRPEVLWSREREPLRKFSDIVLEPANQPEAVERTHALSRIEALSPIWCHALSLAQSAGTSFREVLDGLPLEWDEATSTSDIGELVERLWRAIGADSMIDAYYDGVPLEDILA